MSRRAGVLIVGLALLVVTLTSTAAALAGGTEGGGNVIVPRHHPVRGKSQRVWVERWVRAYLQEPADSNPLIHPELCALPGPHGVLYMTSPEDSVTIHCQVRAGQPLLFSPGGQFCSGASDGAFTATELRNCIEFFLGADFRKLTVHVDGVAADMTDRLFFTPRMIVHLPDGNIFGVPETTTPAKGAGWFVFVKLSQGHHVVRMTDSLGGSVVRFDIQAV